MNIAATVVPNIYIIYDIHHIADVSVPASHKETQNLKQEAVKKFLETKTWYTIHTEWARQVGNEHYFDYAKPLKVSLQAQNTFPKMEAVFVATTSGLTKERDWFKSIGFKTVRRLSDQPNWSHNGDSKITLLIYKFPVKKEQVQVESSNRRGV